MTDAEQAQSERENRRKMIEAMERLCADWGASPSPAIQGLIALVRATIEDAARQDVEQ